MPCPDPGALRAMLDTAAHDDVAAHVAGCTTCAAELARLRRDAELAAPAVALLSPPDDPPEEAVSAALRRVTARRAAAVDPAPSGTVTTRPRRRFPRRARTAVSGMVAALTLVLAVVTPTGRSLAAQFLDHFRSEQFTVLETSPDQGWAALDALGRLGTAGTSGHDLRSQQVASLDAASRAVGFPLHAPAAATLPEGVTADPVIAVIPARQLRFTFEHDRIRAYLDQAGEPRTQVPAAIDGTSLVVDLPAAAVLTYKDSDGIPALLVGQAGTLEVGTDGAMSLERLRAFLLDLPGLPEETVAQLRAIDDWERTLPIPLPDGADWEETTVAGARGLEVEQGVGGAMVWQREGRVYGVAGLTGVDELRRVGESLR